VSLSLQQLLTPKTEEQALDELLAFLDSIGFTATSWQSGSKQRHVVQLLARLRASFSNTTLLITKGRFNDTAEGAWLHLLSKSHYNNEVVPAETARIRIRLIDSAGAGPFTVNTGNSIAKDENGVTYRNMTGVSLPEDGDILVDYESESPGALAEIPVNISLVTPMAGVNVSLNTVIRPGANEESDVRLRDRNRSKWSTLSQSAPGDAYRTWALEASPSVTRVWVDDLNPRGPGSIDVIIAGVSGALPGAVADTVEDYINGGVDGVFRRPLGANLDVVSATNYTVNVTGTVYSNGSYDLTAVRTAAHAAIDAYISIVPVGGTVLLAELYRRVMAVAGVRNVQIASPTADVVVTAGRVPVSNPNLVSLH
jgi:uncharacterized phage protein gp47/JayE